jgi:glutaredoxin 3
MADKLLAKKGVTPEKIQVDEEPARREEMLRLSGGRTTVPQIFIGTRHIGGYTDMAALDMKGELDALLQAP